MGGGGMHMGGGGMGGGGMKGGFGVSGEVEGMIEATASPVISGHEGRHGVEYRGRGDTQRRLKRSYRRLTHRLL